MNKDSAYDRVLLVLALLAPLALLVLGKWRASLETWYAPLDSGQPVFAGAKFDRRVAAWLQQQRATGAKLILITDRACACTAPTRSLLEDSRSSAKRADLELLVYEVDDPRLTSDRGWRDLIDEIPSTPTLLAIDDGRLLYAGPVAAGDFCTTAVSRVLGLDALDALDGRPVLNWLGRGCFCPIHRGKQG